MAMDWRRSRLVLESTEKEAVSSVMRANAKAACLIEKIMVDRRGRGREERESGERGGM